MHSTAIEIDRGRSAARIQRDIEVLSGPAHTTSKESISRYAYTDAYRSTVDYFRRELAELGFASYEDPVGTLVARNRQRGEPVFGIGSHCDSNRNGGKYDGTLGVVTALELCRLNVELDLGIGLQLVSFLEEEGSGFGQMLLGSRICAQRVTEDDLHRFTALDDGRSFWQHAKEAGYHPERWREAIQVLENMTGWIELHIEQGRVLQDTQKRIGVVNAIAGYIHADIHLHGRADHAGATPMDLRLDAALPAAECVLELERLAVAAGNGTVGTVGELELHPGLLNVVPGQCRLSLDIRGVDDKRVRDVASQIADFAERAAASRGMRSEFVERQAAPATILDEGVAGALEAAADGTGEPYAVMHSGAAHDTICVATHVPSAMLFVPCADGISHSPLEDADPADAALGVEVVLNAIRRLTGG